MNILMVLPYFGGLRGGNPDVVDLASRLQERGHTVVVLTAAYTNDLLYENINGVKIFRAKPLHYLSRIDYGVSFPIYEFYRLVRSFDIEVVHGIMLLGTQTLSAAFLSRFLRKPFVLTIQGLDRAYVPYIDAMARIFNRSLAQIVSLGARKAIALSGNLLETAYRIGFTKEKTEVIPTSIPYETEFNPRFFDSSKERKELGIDDKIVVCFVGRLVRLKGLIFLLHAQKMLQKSIANLHLLIVGYGPDRSLIESMAKKFDLKTTFVGYVDRSRIPFYLSAADIFVNPSLSEGLPLTVMEAMAMQKAVIATNVGGTSDLVRDGENGFLVPLGDAKSIANAIETLALDDKLRLKMGSAGRDIIERSFDWETIVRKVENVYEEVLC
jgi:glycosyltransferase involved in cell wall biosynthesis